jgi:hypothetical protein
MNTTLGTSKTASRPQPASAVEPTGPKNMENNITVLRKQPETIGDTDEAQCSAPNQKATTTRPKRALATDPSTSKTNKEWNEEDEESDAIFAKSSRMSRTPTQQCCTPPEAAMTMAPKKKETVLMRKLRASNVTNTTTRTCEQSDEVNTISLSKDVIEALKKVQHVLTQTSIKKEEKIDASQIVGLAIDHIIEMNKKFEELEEHHNHNQQARQPSAEDNPPWRVFEEQLAKITKAITEPTRTYAQVAQSNPVTSNTGNHPTQSENRIKERVEKLKRERAKTEVIITTRDVNDNIKNQLANMSEEELMNNIQQAIIAAGKEQIKVRKVQKITNHGIKIRCATDKEAEEVRSMEWKTIIEGAKTIETTYRAVVHGVSKYDIDFEKDKPEEIIARIQNSNSEEITVERVEPLMKRPRNPNARTQSIIITFKYSKEADDCIKTGVHIENRHYAIVERYIPQSQIKQCFKCQAYGHKASVCTRKARCGKCAQEHETKDCQSEMVSCANCKDSHCAWSHECPVRQQKREQGETLRNQLSDLHTS